MASTDQQDKAQYTVEPLQNGAATQNTAPSNSSKYTVEPVSKGADNSSAPSKYTVEPIDKPVRGDDTEKISHPENYGFTVHNVVKNAGDALQSMIAMPGQVYHAFADEPTDEETNKAAEQERKNLQGKKPDVTMRGIESVTNPNGTPLGGARRVGLGLTRLLEPGYEQEQRRADEEKEKSDKALAEGSKTGTIAPGTVGHGILSLGHRAASVVPLIGPLAGELADQTFVQGDPGGALAKAGTYYATGKVIENLPKLNKAMGRGIPIKLPGAEEPAYIQIPGIGHGARAISKVADRIANIPKVASDTVTNIGEKFGKTIIPGYPGLEERLANLNQQTKDPFERRGEIPSDVLGGVRADEIGNQARGYAKKLGLSKIEPIDINQSVVDEFRKPSADYWNPGNKTTASNTGSSGRTQMNTEPTALAKSAATPVAPVAKKVAPVKPADLERQINEGLGNEPVKPGVPMKEQKFSSRPAAESVAGMNDYKASEYSDAALKHLGWSDKEIADFRARRLAAQAQQDARAKEEQASLSDFQRRARAGELTPEEPVKVSSEPRKAVLQKAGATPEEIEKILPKGAKPGQTGITKVEMSKLAEHFGVDIGDSAIGRGKGDLAAGTHMTQDAVLQKIIDAGYSPADIAKAIDEGKHLPTVSGGSQGATEASRSDDLARSAKEFTEKMYPGIRDTVQQIENRMTSNTGARPVATGVEATSTAPTILPKEANIAADVMNRKMTAASRPISKETSDINALHDVRARLGLPGSESKPSLPESMGGQKPVTKAPERLATRATAGYAFSEAPGDLLTRHTIEVKDPQGKSLGKVSAMSENDHPETWTVRLSAAAKPGTGLVQEGYAKLAEEAAKQGKTLRGDSVQSDSAKAVWSNLKRMGFDVKMDGETPYIEPPSTKPKARGFGRAKQ